MKPFFLTSNLISSPPPWKCQLNSDFAVRADSTSAYSTWLDFGKPLHGVLVEFQYLFSLGNVHSKFTLLSSQRVMRATARLHSRAGCSPGEGCGAWCLISSNATSGTRKGSSCFEEVPRQGLWEPLFCAAAVALWCWMSPGECWTLYGRTSPVWPLPRAGLIGYRDPVGRMGMVPQLGYFCQGRALSAHSTPLFSSLFSGFFAFSMSSISPKEKMMLLPLFLVFSLLHALLPSFPSPVVCSLRSLKCVWVLSPAAYWVY